VERRLSSGTLEKPTPSDEVSEHNDVATIEEDHFEVAPSQRPAGPPSILHYPLFAHAINVSAGDVPG
jgi:hypothetical protein